MQQHIDRLELENTRLKQTAEQPREGSSSAKTEEALVQAPASAEDIERQATEHDSISVPEVSVSEHSNTPAQTLPPGVEEIVDVASGNVYYYNSEMRDTTWERPSELGLHTATEAGDRAETARAFAPPSPAPKPVL